MSTSDLPKTSAPAARAFDRHGIAKLTDLTRYSEQELLQLHGVGPKAIRILKAALRERHLDFKP